MVATYPFSLLLKAPRPIKKLIVLTADVVMMVIILNLLMIIRQGHLQFYVPWPSQGFIYGITLVCLLLSGVYQAVLRAFDDRLMKNVLLALAAFLAVVETLRYVGWLKGVPPLLPFGYAFGVFTWMWLSRSLAKALLHQKSVSTSSSRVMIYGAGQAGRQLMASLREQDSSQVFGFFDDDPTLIGGYVAGARVYAGNQAADIIQKQDVNTVLLAMPRSSRYERKLILDRLSDLKVKVQSLPGIHQLIEGKASMSDVREVDIADLLGRDPVPPVDQLFRKNIEHKVVMVTGAGGSIGSELCRQIIKSHPKALIIFELSEFALYSIEKELRALTSLPIIAILGSVAKEERLREIMQRYCVQTVYHAAAYKHVPLVEMNPFEGVINNTLGTAHCALAAMHATVETFVLISTDKAVRPTNVMGATKRLAELVCQGLAQLPNSKTQFSMVRFGNVLGSSGSVVPLFRQQLKDGGPLTVTDPEMTRYFMTIPEAAQLVIQAGAMGTGGDVFLLDMGEPVKINDLARKMIQLSGLAIKETEDGPGDIGIRYSGLRPGEKLYEELLIDGDNISRTTHPLIMRSVEKSLAPEQVEELLNGIRQAAKDHDLQWLLTTLESHVEGYKRAQHFVDFEQNAEGKMDIIA